MARDATKKVSMEYPPYPRQIVDSKLAKGIKSDNSPTCEVLKEAER